MNNIIKLSLIQLNNTPNYETVKVAGLLHKIKNWIKEKLNSDFADSVKYLKTKSKNTKEIIDQLSTNIDYLQDAINNGDLASYEFGLEKVKELSIKLIDNIQKSKTEVKEVKDIIVKTLNKNYYDKELMKTPEFKEKFKQSLPSNYDIELNKIYRQPLKSFNYYKNLEPNSIIISPISLNILIEKTLKSIQLLDPSFQESQIESTNLSEKVKESIVNGLLIEATSKAPSKQVTQQQFGITELEISSAPFTLPGTNIIVQYQFILVDRSTGLANINRISLKATNHVGILSKTSSLKEKLLKISAQIPYKVYTFSNLDFANIMRKGYQIAFGQDPSLEVLAGGWAQAVLESGQPIKLPNNNIGNLKATSSWINNNKLYFTKSTKEYTSSGKPFVQENAAWQAFNTPEEGAAAYWKLLGNKFNESLQWMAAGDPTSAAVVLGKKGYYTANIEKYSTGVNNLYNYFMKTIASQLPGIKSNIQAAPGIKPEVKSWKSEYTNQNSSSDLDELVQKLVANNKITNIVKQAILKDNLQKSNILLKINSINPIISLEFAKKLAYILQKYCSATTKICKNSDKIELEAKVVGNPITIYNSVGAISDCLCVSLADNIGEIVEVILAPNIISKLAEISSDELFQNTTKFNNFLGFKNG